jgi:hypothetical protein
LSLPSPGIGPSGMAEIYVPVPYNPKFRLEDKD